MTNEQAIMKLKYLQFNPTTDEFDEEALDMAIDALRDTHGKANHVVAEIKVDTDEIMERIEQEWYKPSEWIPCSERLPKENTEVLMSLAWGIDIGEYRDGNWHSEWINHYDDDDVLAWMPLPEPAKLEND